MEQGPKIKTYSFTMDCQDPHALAEFYAALLKWDLAFYNEEWACIGAPGKEQGAYPGLTFQRNPEYQPPVWPAEGKAQQQMAHLDLAVDDLEKAVAYAIECGATKAEKQFSSDWTVMLDPAGHPFCLCQMKAVMESPQFALL